MVERKNGDRTKIWLGIGGCKRLCRRGRGHSLVTLISLSVSVKNRPLHKALGKSQTYYPEHILGFGRLEDLLLSYRRSGSFRTDC